MRKSSMLTVMALAVVAFASVSASAAADIPFEIHTDAGLPCPAVSESDNEVSGGCVIEDFEGELQLHHLGSALGDYPVDFDLVLDANGQGYAVDPVVGESSGFQRKACDEADGTPKPWAVQLRGVYFDHVEVDIMVGMTVATNPPGTACTQQQITVREGHQFGGTDFTQESPSMNIQNGFWHSDGEIEIYWMV